MNLTKIKKALDKQFKIIYTVLSKVTGYFTDYSSQGNEV